MKKLKVAWVSAGVSSFVASWLVRDTVDKFLYIDIKDQHSDSIRFIHDIEPFLGKDIKILRSPLYNCVEDVWRAYEGIYIPGRGAFCTTLLKRDVRKSFESFYSDYEITYVWGLDVDEKERADRLIKNNPGFLHEFPLIDRMLTKQDVHGICNKLGIKRPLMYDLGYNNNNCIGCVKGGMGYWNKIRVDFPDVFKNRSYLERLFGHSILKDDKGPVFLDELDPSAGRESPYIDTDCSLFCLMNI